MYTIYLFTIDRWHVCIQVTPAVFGQLSSALQMWKLWSVKSLVLKTASTLKNAEHVLAPVMKSVSLVYPFLEAYFKLTPSV